MSYRGCDRQEICVLFVSTNCLIAGIRKMQGIIFGCIAGIVVAICSIIGGICYCRYQRKLVFETE